MYTCDTVKLYFRSKMLLTLTIKHVYDQGRLGFVCFNNKT